MMLLKKEMSVKQEEDVVQLVKEESHEDDVVQLVKEEDVVQPMKEEPHEDLLIQADAQRRLCVKRLTRNAYMKKYRAHHRLLPTYAALSRFRSPIKFSTSSGIRCNAEIFNDNLHVRLHHDTSLCEDHISFLPSCPVMAKKIVSMAMLQAYKI